MLTLEALLARHGLRAFAGAIDGLSRKSYRLQAESASNEPVSRLGGQPNIPTSIPWPEWNGQSLAFIAQIDLTKLPTLEALPLSAKGALYFFYEGSGEVSGSDVRNRGAWRVIYSETPLADVGLRTYPEDLLSNSNFEAHDLDFASKILGRVPTQGRSELLA